jgi:Putative adhesin
MQRLTFAVLALVLAVSPLALADDWSKTYTISGKPDLRVDTSDANIRVDTWDKNTIDVHITSSRYKFGDNGLRVIEHQNGDSVELELRYPHHVFVVQFGSYKVDIDIHMPRQGRVNLRTGDGSIELSNFKGDMDLESGDGHEQIEAVDGNLRARSGDGHIRATGRFDALDLNTGDGRIEARILPGSTMASSWNVHTGDGGVRLELPETFAADVDLHTNDGHINVEMPVTVDGRIGDKNIHGKINGGGNLLTIHTGDGSIRLEKS